MNGDGRLFKLIWSTGIDYVFFNSKYMININSHQFDVNEYDQIDDRFWATASEYISELSLNYLGTCP